MLPSNHLSTLLLLPSVFPSIRVFPVNQLFASGSQSIGVSGSSSISPSSEYSGLIVFKIDWFDLAVKGTHKSLLQHHSSKASVLQHSFFFTVQLSHPYVTTGKASFDYMDLCWQSNGVSASVLPVNIQD